MNTTAYTPDHGTTEHSVCLWFLRNPDEELDAKDILIKFGGNSTNPRSALKNAVEFGLLTQMGTTYRAGPHIGQLEVAPKDHRPAPLKPGPAKKTPRPEYAVPDISKVTLQMEPLTKAHLTRGRSKWNDLLNKLAAQPIVGGNHPTFRFHRSLAGAIKKAIQLYHKTHTQPGAARLRCVIVLEECVVQRIS